MIRPVSSLIHRQTVFRQSWGAMARIADASLAGAVSEAGGLGIIACGGAPLDWVEEQVRIARSITDKPIGANVMLMDPNTGETAELLAKLRVDVITTGAGSPANYMQLWKDAGIKVLWNKIGRAHV